MAPVSRLSRRDFMGYLALGTMGMGLCGIPEIGKSYHEGHEAQYGKRIELPAPEWFGELVGTHVGKMLEKGYAEKISFEDLDHGHILLEKNPGNIYESLDEMLDYLRLLLYHTDEGHGRWGSREKNLPVGKKTPRSVAGFMDGRISPAIDLLGSAGTEKPMVYENFGTVYGSDLTAVYESLYEGSLKKDKIHFMLEGEPHRLEFSFMIRENQRGRFHGGDKTLSVSFGCFPEEPLSDSILK